MKKVNLTATNYGRTVVHPSNTVVRISDKEIFVQVNCAGSLLHGSLLAFDKNTNETKVNGVDGSVVIYKIQY